MEGQAERKPSWTQATLKRQVSRQVAVRHLSCEERVYAMWTQSHTAHNGCHSSSASGAFRTDSCRCHHVYAAAVVLSWPSACAWMFCYLLEDEIMLSVGLFGHLRRFRANIWFRVRHREGGGVRHCRVEAEVRVG